MKQSSSERIAQQLAERLRKRVVQQDAEILRLNNLVIDLAGAVKYFQQRFRETEAKLDGTGEVPG